MREIQILSGWILWGLSPFDDLKETDGVIAWVDDTTKTPHLYDVHYDNETNTVIDQEQNYHLLQMHQTDEATSFTFKRKLRTEDPSDFLITRGNVKLQWGWGRNDPDQPRHIPVPAELETVRYFGMQ